ncbi:hypothetical protein ESB00_12630 [Oleiharenicola lentus]|jgi:hypothetical protein|uniref:Uncharacterized protein n=1 Tax=Oleiharenicola lentus TaxID=2508720 RepID=A0A4Q1CC40_9BACT|nr:hypothetical protein [Oleiharenicola lentus]RXK56674.1 hypothetical protein ESB00_12630 [Oleiharenicola lentus]
MSLPKDQAWFPAKTYGWGWGVPTRWQGWVVTFGFLGAMTLGGIFIAPRSVPAYIGYVLVLAAILTGICYAKGETPRWRWGEDEADHKR